MAAAFSISITRSTAYRAFTSLLQGHIFAPAAETITKARHRGTILERLLKAAVNTWNGLAAATRSEEAFRQELVVLGLAIPLAFVVTEGGIYAFVLIAVVLMVMAVELLNTSIEKLSDFVTPERDDRIKRIKDMGSAAVGLAIIAAGCVWVQALAARFGWL